MCIRHVQLQSMYKTDRAMQPDNPKPNATIYPVYKRNMYQVSAAWNRCIAQQVISLVYIFMMTLLCFGRHLQSRLEVVREESVLEPTHEFVGLFGQTESQDLNTHVSDVVTAELRTGLYLQCEARYGPSEQRSPCKWRKDPQSLPSWTDSQTRPYKGHQSGCTFST